MLSRQCRGRLSYCNRIPNTRVIRRAFIARTLTAGRVSPRFPALVPPVVRGSQSRRYAQSTTLESNDFTPLSAFSHHPPSVSTSSDLPGHLENLRIHLAASLLPLHQPLISIPSSAEPQLSRTVKESEDGASSHSATISFASDDGLGESVLGIVSPFEGGECYNLDAVLETAGRLGADVVRIDLALAIGLPESSGIKGAPRLPDHKNPLLADENHAGEIEDLEEDMDFPGDERGGHIKIPVMTLGAMPTQARASPGINIEWVQLFHSMINFNESDRPRIVVLESCATMLSTFPIWWPSLAQVLRTRRRHPRPSSGRKSAAKSTLRELTKPTTVVLSCAPSLFASHTGASHSQTNVAPHEDDDANWWGSAEIDGEGRRLRNNHRLETLRDSELDARQLMPSADPPRAPAPNPILAALASKLGSQSSEEEASDRKLLWKALPIVPLERDLELESRTRTSWRWGVSSRLLVRALEQLESTVGNIEQFQTDASSSPWAEHTISWKQAQELAIQAVGRQRKSGSKITIAELKSADQARKQDDENLSERIGHLLPPLTQSSTAPDTIVSALRKSPDLNKYEKRLSPCIVDAQKLAATDFSRVHLPTTTVDAIRTMVSLPLLYPEAFKTGILGDHSAGGALLFGPPGTGKTLLARAVAAESGARMLAIQPSDVNDMYVGEGEKLVRAVFSLARRLSPCVVFIDEVDSLFGARSGKDSGSGRSHNQLLTEFMQEMDGLNSAVTNREQRIVVVGATNRPFDLDEAILRRLPRRLLIDLPGLDDRRAILEILLQKEHLAADVDLSKLAALTDGFSGSDLKHLCVAAALAALKQTVELPWSAGSKKPSLSAIRSGQSGLQRETVQPTPTDSHVSDEPMRQTIETRSTLPSVAERATLIQAGSWRSALINNRQQTSSKISHSRSKTTSQAPETSTVESADQIPTRVLQWQHFESALSEISPSSTEDGTLPELKKWAEQYGDGGTKRSPRKGFGKSFGFGNLSQGSQSRYGRVKAEE